MDDLKDEFPHLPERIAGLGFLAGDHLKECSDLGIPLVAVGFMYRDECVHQKINADGWQGNVDEILDREAAPITRVLDDQGAQLIVTGIDLGKIDNFVDPGEEEFGGRVNLL